MSSSPRVAPSSLNWTPATPLSSDAVAETATDCETVAPPAGDEIATVGGLFTVTVTAAAVAEFPAASRATALRTWGPPETPGVLQEKE